MKMYIDLLKKAAAQKKENETIARQLKIYKNRHNVDLLKQYNDSVFTEIQCLSCANCCKTSPPMLNQSDIKRIAHHIGIPPKQFIKKYVIEDINGEKSFSTVPCVFLQPDNSCSIYEVRPEACRRYPHTDEEDYFFRAVLNVKNTLICPGAFLIFQKIKTIIQEK